MSAGSSSRKTSDSEEEDEFAEDKTDLGAIETRLGFRKERRASVSAEKYNPEEDTIVDIEFHRKTPEQRQKIENIIHDIFLFRGMDEKDAKTVIDAMTPREVSAGETIIQQGDEGDNFYVIERGDFEAHITDSKGVSKVVHRYEGTGSFGELALMYNSPRAATVVAVTDGFLWIVTRDVFKRLVLKSAFEKRQRYENLLTTVPELVPLSPYERAKVSDALIPKSYSEGEIIFHQYDPGDGMYFVESGEVIISQTDNTTPDSKGQELTRIRPGGYFGELALVNSEPRAAAAIAATETKVAFLEIQAFERLLGPCMNLLHERIKGYNDKGKDET